MTSPRRRLVPLLLVAVLALAAGACGDDGGDESTGDGSSTTTTSPSTDGTSDPSAPPSSTGTDGTTTEPFAGDIAPKTAEPDGTGTAQLVGVRLGQQPGVTRFVLEFAGEEQPGYDVQWVDGPITEDGSGNPVAVEGDAFLQVLVQPATGFDLDAGVPTYEGPTRLAGPDGGAITEAVRTGDFEALLTWVLGAGERVPFTVSTLSSPSRLVIDLQDG